MALGREVRAHDLVSLGERPAHETTELLERGVRDPVASEEAVPPARHETLLEEQRQVLARIGLGRIGQRAQLLNRPLLAEQGLEQRQTCRVAERSKAPREDLERLA
jgi:hypothetical protein